MSERGKESEGERKRERAYFLLTVSTSSAPSFVKVGCSSEGKDREDERKIERVRER